MKATLIERLKSAADSAYPYNTAMVPAELLREAVAELSSAPAPKPDCSGESQAGGRPLTWDEAHALANTEAIHEALGNFAHDPTEDNAVHVILAVLQSKK